MLFVSTISGPYDKTACNKRTKIAMKAVKKLPFKGGRRVVQFEVPAGNGLGRPGYYETSARLVEIQSPYGGPVPSCGYFKRIRGMANNGELCYSDR